MSSETLVVVDILAKRFEDLGIPYYVGGSVASSVYGVFRATNDADIVVDLKESSVPDLVTALSNDFYIDADMIRNALHHGISFNVIHLPTMVKADLFPLNEGAFERSEMGRRRPERIRILDNSEDIYFASPEDMVLQKLRWYRATGERSDRQWYDVQGILKVQGTSLDFDYMRYWAAELQITDLLRQAFDDAGV
ncbi:MAG: hypothetical protein SFU56_14545 [Capsulimonadales bacterium]|nr:hypothetical protein [Capsulimonadales bacterium]